MKNTLITLLSASLASVLAIPFSSSPSALALASRQTTSCANTAISRSCWGTYSIDTDYYENTPNTGVTREYWLSAENSTIAPDGYERWVLAFNGTSPGPAIIADWGDNLVIHVTNNMEVNGTSIHWLGIRQLGSTEMDGLLGPLIINGPATADYDEDLGMLFLSDWSHIPAAQLWSTAKLGAPPTLETGLINGTNTFDCSGSTDPNCIGGGKKFETVFEAGKKYRIRIINSALEAHFQFSIDGHSLTVIGNDLVPLVPYAADSVLISMGQRYDVIVEANATPGNYWMRAGWVTACSTNLNPSKITGIVRYDASSTTDHTTTSDVTATTSCGDEPLASLVPYLAMDVDNLTASDVTEEDLSFAFTSYFTWTLNSSSLLLDWTDPTVLKIFNNETIWLTDYNVVPLTQTDSSDIWTVLVIQDQSGIGLTHPIHLHGHDFWVIAQESGLWDFSTATLNLSNPPRRDVASLPPNGYLAIAFKKDNPGSWLVHCHIAWHASQGLAMQFVERESEIMVGTTDKSAFEDVCTAWDSYAAKEVYEQDDSGI